MWSPNAQGGPGWKDTHPVAWNVAFGDEGLPEARAPGGARSYLRLTVCTRGGSTRSLRCVLGEARGQLSAHKA